MLSLLGLMNGARGAADGLGVQSSRMARLCLVVLTAAALSAAAVAAQEQGPTRRPVSITASRYKFVPSRIEVTEGDLVQVELKTADISHSFTIDGYRISKRVNPGKPVTFEFRADRAGTFPFSCTLQIDEGCARMRGELVVKPR